MDKSCNDKTVGDVIVERLRDWGVQRIFGYSGDTIDGILAALDRAGNRPEWIPSAHEEIAGLMACAHAKFTGEVGVCMATSGPGAIHLLNGLYDANRDHQPVVAIVGQQNLMAMGSHYQQEIDLPVLLKDVAGAFVRVVADPAQVRHTIDRALGIALGERSVTSLIVPHDVQNMPAVATPPHEHGAQHSGVGYARPRVLPLDADLDRAAEVLNAGSRVAILAGAGALGAGGPLLDVAERLGAGIAKALLGKAAVPDDQAFVTGPAGWLGSAASNWCWPSATPCSWSARRFPTPSTFQRKVRRAASRSTLRRACSACAIRCRSTWSATAPRPSQRCWSGWRSTATAHGAKRSSGAGVSGIPSWCGAPCSTPTRSTPSASSSNWTSPHRRHDPDRRLRFLDRLVRALPAHPRRHAGVAVGHAGDDGLGAAVHAGRQAAYPDRPVVATLGDGTMQMSGLNALINVAASYRRWEDPRLVVVLLNNRDLNYVSWEQRLIDSAPRFPAAQGVPDLPYARYAELLGLRGVRVDAPDQVAAALDEAFAADRPFLIEAVTVPTVPPVPPKLTPELREKLEQALAQGDYEARQVMERLDAEDALPG